MFPKKCWTWIVVVVGTVTLCWVAAFAIEDAGKYPYRACQKTSTKNRLAPALPDMQDGLLPFMR